MSDILIRDVSDATMLELDRLAHEQGISRNEYVRRLLDQSVRDVEAVTVDDLRRVGQLAQDLLDPEVMRGAWS